MSPALFPGLAAKVIPDRVARAGTKVVAGARVVALAPDGGPDIVSTRYRGVIVLVLVDGAPRPKWRVRGWTARGDLVGCPCDGAGADLGPGEVIPEKFGAWMREAVAKARKVR